MQQDIIETDTRHLHRALIVDDHPLFCDALALTLRAVAGVRVVETAGSLGAALDRLKRDPHADVVVLDLDLPDVDGLDGLLRLRAALPGIPVLVVSSMSGDHLVSAALSAGAAGFVPKHSGREAFRTAFDALRAGRIYAPDGYDPVQAASDPASDVVGRLAQLTRQQTRILDLICHGMLNKQIAHELSIAETTVKAHVTAIMRKLGVQSRTQAVLIAQQVRFSAIDPQG
ncbi:response regulator transcription factor [Rhodobacteraceae bacterium 2376]|uniref:Response regulator transcription factor n=1 Tax=Rhabdonatronobacter sediminivivens TaxID=2743469 RepID=A0A7Z0I049_9RHOB|nr:response regulator transcription factor [Rhabdonatronobacter sediminivivens]NYS25458.1 response regulator transcription factor [Rhabdonatronobacter sediminivivens]